MDPITQILGEFCKLFEIDEKKTDTAFEHFCNYCCVNKEMELLILNLKKYQQGRMRRELMELLLL